MKLKPVDAHVLVRPLKSEEKTQSGIFLPDTAKEKSQEGEIVAVGTDEDLKNLFKVGDRVIFKKYAGDEIKIDGEEHLLLERGDVLAIIEG